MKTLGSLLIIALLASAPLQAKQPPASPDLAPIISQLELDNEQAARLNDLVQQHHQQMKAQRQERNKSRGEMHQMREQHREELLTVLNHEQLYRFEKYMHDQRRQHRGERPSSQTDN